MDTSEKKKTGPGRPKATPQTGPLVLDGQQKLTEVRLSLPAGTAAILAEYVAWVRQCGDMTADEATTKTVDFALRDVFRRDRLWRNRKTPERRPASPPEPTNGAPQALPPPLPPPSAARPVPSVVGASGTR